LRVTSRGLGDVYKRQPVKGKNLAVHKRIELLLIG
jgi:hypothetical protein